MPKFKEIKSDREKQREKQEHIRMLRVNGQATKRTFDSNGSSYVDESLLECFFPEFEDVTH